jgi:plasmid stability protein
MRTTLTIDDDVAAALERRRAERGTGLRREVNDLLRAGLAADDRAGAARGGEAYELPTFDPGRALITDPRALKELLDDEDDARALGRRA